MAATSRKPVQDRYSRYLAVVRKLERRYRVDGALLISVGGQPSRYSRVEVLAFWRYVMNESREVAAARLAAVNARAQEICEEAA